MIQKKTVIVNKNGVHMRPCGEITAIARNFESTIEISRCGHVWTSANGILDLMLLAMVNGDEIIIKAEGTDENDAVDAIIELIQNGFEKTCVEEKK